MLLFKNSIITLDYNPAADILEVAYPDLHGFLLPEIKHSIDIMIDNVKNYDVKRILLDSTRTVISVSDEESKGSETGPAAIRGGCRGSHSPRKHKAHHRNAAAPFPAAELYQQGRGPGVAGCPQLIRSRPHFI